MRGHRSGVLEHAAIGEIGSDASGPVGVTGRKRTGCFQCGGTSKRTPATTQPETALKLIQTATAYPPVPRLPNCDYLLEIAIYLCGLLSSSPSVPWL